MMRNLMCLALLSVFLALPLAMTGCGSVQEQYVDADESTRDTVGVEWLQMSADAYRQNPDGTFEQWVTDIKDADGNVVETREDQLKRRTRKFDTWGVRINAAKKQNAAPSSGDGDGQ